MMKKLRRISYSLKTQTQDSIWLIKSRLMQFVWGLPTINLEDIIKEDIKLEPPILDDICLPPYHSRYHNHDDFIPFVKIIKFFQPKIVLELGTAYGNMTANICRQCPNVKVYTVNAPIDKQTGIITTYKLLEDEIGRVYKKYGFANRITQIFENTLYLNPSQYFTEPIIDIAIIDACHDAEYVLNDSAKVSPFIRKGGIVLFHDTHPSMEGHLVGSYMACMILRKKGYDIRHIKNTWWGIWVKTG